MGREVQTDAAPPVSRRMPKGRSHCGLFPSDAAVEMVLTPKSLLAQVGLLIDACLACKLCHCPGRDRSAHVSN
jgi:hypothetical protein